MNEKKQKLILKNCWPFYLLNHGVKTVYREHTLPSFLYAYFVFGIKFIMRHHFIALVCLSILFAGMRIEASISRLMDKIVVETSTFWPGLKLPSQNDKPLIDSLGSRYRLTGRVSMNGSPEFPGIYLNGFLKFASASYNNMFLPPPASGSLINGAIRHSLLSIRKAEIENGDVEIFVKERSIPQKRCNRIIIDMMNSNTQIRFRCHSILEFKDKFWIIN